MFEWNVEHMNLTKNKHEAYFDERKVNIYDCEAIVSREDKIAFVDKMQDGELSYLMSLIEKFEADKGAMPRDSWGNVKTVSLKAWIKRNDTRYAPYGVIDCTYRYGEYFLLGTKRNIKANSKGPYDIYEDLVDEMFHRQLRECENKEKEYFLEHDEYSRLKKELREKNRHSTTFGVRISFDSNGDISIWGGKEERRPITIDELKELLAKYEQIDAFIEKLTAETHISY